LEWLDDASLARDKRKEKKRSIKAERADKRAVSSEKRKVRKEQKKLGKEDDKSKGRKGKQASSTGEIEKDLNKDLDTKEGKRRSIWKSKIILRLKPEQAVSERGKKSFEDRLRVIEADIFERKDLHLK